MVSLPIDLILRRLQTRLRREGGEVLPDSCEPEELLGFEPGTQPYGPEFKPVQEAEPGSGVGVVPAYTTGCGGQTRFAQPYEGEDGVHSVVTACATDDLAMLWPRYNDAPHMMAEQFC